MFGLSILGGVLTAGVGALKLQNDFKSMSIIDEKFHKLAQQQAHIYQNTVQIANDKRLLALNTLSFNYNNAGFSTKGGTGAKEASAIETSFNNVLSEMEYKYGIDATNLEEEHQNARNNQHLKTINDVASVFSGIMNYARQANEYSGKKTDAVDTTKQNSDVTSEGGGTTNTNTNKPVDSQSGGMLPSTTATTTLEEAHANISSTIDATMKQYGATWGSVGASALGALFGG